MDGMGWGMGWGRVSCRKHPVITPLASPVLAAPPPSKHPLHPKLNSKSPSLFCVVVVSEVGLLLPPRALCVSIPSLLRRTESLLVVVRCCGQACNFPITAVLLLPNFPCWEGAISSMIHPL